MTQTIVERATPRRVVGTVAVLLGAGVAWSLVPGDPPFGILLNGVVIGSLYALVAIGLVLVYRSGRIINFAQAGLGAVPAVAALLLYTNRGVPYALVVVGLLVAAPGAGIVVERTVIRRFKDSSRLILTVATIGVAQVLAFVEFFTPRWITGDSVLPTQFSTPVSRHRAELGGVVFTGDHAAAIVVVGGLVAGITYFLRSTRAGIAIRAVAENRDRADLLGIPVARLGTIVWALAALFSAVAVFFRGPLVGVPIGGLLGPGILLFGLGAAAIGRMESIPIATAGAIGLGVLDQTIFYVTGSGSISLAAILPLILIVLLRRGSGGHRQSDDTSTTWRAVDEVKPIARSLRMVPGVRALRASAIGLGGGLLVALPFLLSETERDLATLLVINAMLAVSLVILTGWAGQISLGQLAFAGIGAVVAGRLTVAAADFFVALAAGALVGAGVAVLVGLPAVRVRGMFLAVTTLAFGAATHLYLLNPRYFGWLLPESTDVVGRPVLWGRIDLSGDAAYYEFCLVVLGLVVASAVAMRRSRTGRLILGVRDNERAAASFAGRPVRVRLTAFAISGFVAALSGGLYAHLIGAIDADVFDVEANLQVFAMAVIGGLGSILGGVLGAAYVVGFQRLLPDYELLATGAGMLVLLLFFPNGLAEVVYRIRDVLVRLIVGAPTPSAELPSPGEALPTDVPIPTASRAPSPPPIDAALVCEGVEVSYGSVQVLFGVDLHVRQGEVVALLGTNGAGKSTVLRSMCGLVCTDAGHIELDGTRIDDHSAADRARAGIAMVPGGRGVFPGLTVAENLEVSTWLLERDRYAAIAEALDLFPRLAERRHSVAGNLSGGEQQMLAIAMALITRPRVLIIDELSLGLAPVIVEQLLEVVRVRNEAGVTVVLVEQSLNVAVSIATRAYFLEKGEVRFEGEPAALLERGDLARSVFLSAGNSVPVAEPVIAPAGPVAGPPRLELEGIEKRFGGILAVDGVDLALGAGECLGLIGPNGAGKTTLFDIVSGFLVPDAGALRLGGHDITALPAHRRAELGLARSFQDARTFSSLTVAENIALAFERHLPFRDDVASALGLPAVRELEVDIAWSVADLIELMGLGPYRDVLARELSTGTRRIVDLAMAVAHGPDVLLLDEPSSGVAQREAEAIIPLVERIRRETGCSVLVIDHDMPLVAALSTEIVALELGRVIARGPASVVLNDPRVVAGYLGSDEATINRSTPVLGSKVGS